MIFLSGRRSSALYFNNLDMRSRAPALTWAGKRKSTLKYSKIFQGIKNHFRKKLRDEVTGKYDGKWRPSSLLRMVAGQQGIRSKECPTSINRRVHHENDLPPFRERDNPMYRTWWCACKLISIISLGLIRLSWHWRYLEEGAWTDHPKSAILISPWNPKSKLWTRKEMVQNVERIRAYWGMITSRAWYLCEWPCVRGSTLKHRLIGPCN